METAVYTVWRPKNIVTIIFLTALINAVLFMGLPALTRMADRDREVKREEQYVLTPRVEPKLHEEQRDKELRLNELKQIPAPKMPDFTPEREDNLKFSLEGGTGYGEGLVINVEAPQGMEVDPGGFGFTPGDVDTMPRVIRAPPVNYPYGAISKGLRGTVYVKVLIGVNGKATNIKAKRAEPPEMLEVFGEEAEKAVARYRFAPATLGGESVPMWAQQPITFDLN
jgi:TonB family protein